MPANSETSNTLHILLLLSVWLLDWLSCFIFQEEKEQLIEYRSTVGSLVGRAKSVVQLRPRSADSNLGTTTPIHAICDYRQIEV